MATVFFKVSPQQEKEIKTFMKAEGYSSKAEFFRFLLKFYKYEKREFSDELEKESKELERVLERLAKEGKLKKYGTLEQQLEDL